MGERIKKQCDQQEGPGLSLAAETGQGGQVWQKLPGWAGRRVVAWLGGWPPQTAFLDGSKLRRSQGFHNSGNRLSKKSRGWGRGRASKTLPRPLTRFYVIAPICPALSWEEDQLQSQVRAKSQSRRYSPHLLLSRTSSSFCPTSHPPPQGSLTPYTSTTLPRRSSFPPGTFPISYRSWPLPIHSPHNLEPPGLPLSLEKAHALA